MEGFYRRVRQDVISKRKRFFQAKSFLGGKGRCPIISDYLSVFLPRVERTQGAGSQARIEKFLTHRLRQHFWGEVGPAIRLCIKPWFGNYF